MFHLGLTITTKCKQSSNITARNIEPVTTDPIWYIGHPLPGLYATHIQLMKFLMDRPVSVVVVNHNVKIVNRIFLTGMLKAILVFMFTSFVYLLYLCAYMLDALKHSHT